MVQYKDIFIYTDCFFATTLYSPLMSDVIPSLLTNMLSFASSFVKSSATIYKLCRTFLAQSSMYSATCNFLIRIHNRETTEVRAS